MHRNLRVPLHTSWRIRVWIETGSLGRCVYSTPWDGRHAEGFIRQARAREQAQELLHELEVTHAQLADYVERVEDLTLTAERQRMARELHDTLAQGLAGLILQLEAVDSHLASQHRARAREIVQQAMARARATLADVLSNRRVLINKLVCISRFDAHFFSG